MLSRDSEAQQRQQAMHRGFRAADGTQQGGIRSVDASNRAERVVKGVKGFVECPFDLAPGLAKIHDACVRSLGGSGSDGAPDTREKQQAKSSTASKLMAVVQSTSSKRKPDQARTKESYRAGVGAHRLTREAAAEQRKAIAPRLTFEQLPEDEVPVEEDGEGGDEGGGGDRHSTTKKEPRVDAATAVARMARLATAITDGADADVDAPQTRTEATQEKERVARQLVRQSNAKQLAEYDAKRHRSEGFVRPPTEAEDAAVDEDCLVAGANDSHRLFTSAVHPRNPSTGVAKSTSPLQRAAQQPSTALRSHLRSPPLKAVVVAVTHDEEAPLEEFADEPPAGPEASSAPLASAAASTAASRPASTAANNKANKAELARLRSLYAAGSKKMMKTRR